MLALTRFYVEISALMLAFGLASQVKISFTATDPFRITRGLFISSNVPKLLSGVSLDCMTKRLTKIACNSTELKESSSVDFDRLTKES